MVSEYPIGATAPVCRSPVYAVPMPDAFYPLIGQILVIWGAFDREIEAFRCGMQAHCNGEDQRSSALNKRLTHLRSLSPKCFPGAPSVNAIFQSICDDAFKLKLHRDAIAHGSLSISNANGGILTARGKSRSYNYKISDMEQLFYDVSHLAGRTGSILLDAISDRDFYTPLAPHEKAALRDFCLRNHPMIPIADRLQTQP